MKQQGEDSAVVAKLLDHSSTRMVDLAYGRLTDQNFVRAAAKPPSVPAPPAGSTSVAAAGHLPGREGLVGLERASVSDEGTEREISEAPRTSRSAEPLVFERGGVPGGGIEPPTRGFSVLPAKWPKARKPKAFKRRGRGSVMPV